MFDHELFPGAAHLDGNGGGVARVTGVSELVIGTPLWPQYGGTRPKPEARVRIAVVP
jgi:hypothetical protein